MVVTIFFIVVLFEFTSRSLPLSRATQGVVFISFSKSYGYLFISELPCSDCYDHYVLNSDPTPQHSPLHNAGHVLN